MAPPSGTLLSGFALLSGSMTTRLSASPTRIKARIYCYLLLPKNKRAKLTAQRQESANDQCSGFFGGNAPWCHFGTGHGRETSTLIVTTVAFGFGGATFGFVAGGFLKPRLRADDQDKGEFEDEPVTNAPGPTNSGSKQFVLDFRTDDDQEAEKASSLLKAAEPERLDQFDGEGRVVATTEVGSGRSDASGS